MLRDKRANSYLTLDPPEYYSDRLMASNVSAPASVGQTSICDLYNDSPLGELLFLYDFTITGTPNTSVAIAPFHGHAISAGNVAVPLNPMNPQKSGAVFFTAGASFSALGYLVIFDSSGQFRWDKEWAFAEIIPGWSLRFNTTGFNLPLTLSAWWLVEPAS